jgi:hypothetical protein
VITFARSRRRRISMMVSSLIREPDLDSAGP